jgi:hypothetical protein
VESFVRVSLLLASEDLRKVQDHGSKMLKVLLNALLHHSASCTYSEMVETPNCFVYLHWLSVLNLQHLLKHRSEKISSTDLLKLKLQLVKLHTDSVVDSAEAISEETVPKIEKAKHKHNTSLLVLAARNNLRSQETGEADGVSASSTPGSSCQSISSDSGKRPLVSGDERVDLSLALDPSFHSGETVSPSMPLKNLGQLIWVSEDEIIDLTIDQTLQQIKSSCSFRQDAHLHSLPFPVDHPIPISSGTLPDYSDTPKRLVLSLESDGRSNGSNGFASTGNRNSCSPGEIDGSILSKSDGSIPEKSDGSNDSSGIMSDKKTQSSDWSVKAMVLLSLH